MQKRLHAIQELAQYLISQPMERRERLTLCRTIKVLANTLEDWLSRETHNAELAIQTLKQIQNEMNEPRSPEAKLDIITQALSNFYDHDIPF